MAAPLFLVILYKSNKTLFPCILFELSILVQNENQMFFLFIFFPQSKWLRTLPQYNLLEPFLFLIPKRTFTLLSFMPAVTFDQNMTPLPCLMLSMWIKGFF